MTCYQVFEGERGRRERGQEGEGERGREGGREEEREGGRKRGREGPNFGSFCESFVPLTVFF